MVNSSLKWWISEALPLTAMASRQSRSLMWMCRVEVIIDECSCWVSVSSLSKPFCVMVVNHQDYACLDGVFFFDPFALGNIEAHRVLDGFASAFVAHFAR